MKVAKIFGSEKLIFCLYNKKIYGKKTTKFMYPILWEKSNPLHGYVNEALFIKNLYKYL